MSRIFNKVFLVGYMGSGKTFLGEKLAKRLQFNFIDTDSFIEKMSGKSVQKIFSDDGSDYFRQLETDSIGLLAAQKKIVISTGGGLPCFNNNMELLKMNGIVIFLNTNRNLLISRLIRKQESRPLIAKYSSKDELSDFIDQHLVSRIPYYQSAHISIEIDNDNLEFMDNLVEYLLLILD